MPLTYSSYLKVDDLTRLQVPASDPMEHDEMLFIIIHQVYELWFKQQLHELQYLQTALEKKDVPTSLATLKRILTILKTMVGQIDVLETMTPLSFASFRQRLESSSGFQSMQFREFEFKLGNKNSKFIDYFPKETPAYQRLEKTYRAPSVYDSFLKLLHLSGYAVPADLLKRDFSVILEENEEVQDILVQIYKTKPELAFICERMVDLDEGIQEWRYRHVKMVERTIGTKAGTGGSSGADYLKRTLFKPLFPDLWVIRSRF